MEYYKYVEMILLILYIFPIHTRMFEIESISVIKHNFGNLEYLKTSSKYRKQKILKISKNPKSQQQKNRKITNIPKSKFQKL